MKRMFIAVLLCGSIISFNNISSVEAATEPVSINANLDSAAEMQQLDAWSHLRNKIFGGKRKDDNNNHDYNGHHHSTHRHDDHHYNRPPNHPGYGSPSHNTNGSHRPNNPPPPHHR